MEAGRPTVGIGRFSPFALKFKSLVFGFIAKPV